MNSLRNSPVWSGRTALVALTVFGWCWCSEWHAVAEPPPAGAKPAASGSADSAQAPGPAAGQRPPEKKGAASGEPSQSTATDAESAAEAERTLDTARRRLVGYRSVRARLTEVVRIGKLPLRIEGTYVQGPQLRLRLEYTLKTAGTTAELLEVCDGQLLLSRRRVGKQVHVTRRDIGQILEALRGSANVKKTVLAFQMGLGGLPALLASMQETMDWHRQEQTTWQGQAAVAIEGRWKPAIRDRLGGERLPGYVPETARIVFDRRTLFPRRIEFFRADDNDPPGRETLLRLSIDDVVLDGPVRDADFTFVPPDDVPIEDVTQAYIQALKPRAAKSPAQSGAAPAEGQP
ncbi:MAG: hypothetical protein D6725_12690 [Planctomycetota bacterium]|nr:MAG: hypothetical protein D6725_12690 [Planctomycetota bacterium]